jgi:hypothetical protein
MNVAAASSQVRPRRVTDGILVIGRTFETGRYNVLSGYRPNAPMV